MALVQGSHGRIGFFEDFLGWAATFSVADATAGTRINDICFIATSGQTEIDYTTTAANGIITVNGAGGAADGGAFVGTAMKPTLNGTMVVGARVSNSSASDGRFFLGFQETVNTAEPVNPFTLSGTTLTANNGGNAAGLYLDFGATTDDWRLMASVNGTAATSGSVRPGPMVYGLNASATTLGSLGIRAGWTPAANSWTILRIEMDPDGTVRGYAGGIGIGDGTGLTLIGTIKAGVVSKTAFYYPILHCAATSTGDPTQSVDYFYANGGRDWTA